MHNEFSYLDSLLESGAGIPRRFYERILYCLYVDCNYKKPYFSDRVMTYKQAALVDDLKMVVNQWKDSIRFSVMKLDALLVSGEAEQSALDRKAAFVTVVERLDLLITESGVTQRNHVERVALGLE